MEATTATATPPFKIILGSFSIARRKILAEMGYKFTVTSTEIDGKCIRKEKPEELVVALAEAKLGYNNQEKDAELTILIAADTAVVYEGAVREKPASVEEARQFMKGYSGGHAATVSSVLVTKLKTGFRKVEWDRVEIFVHQIPNEVIEKLVKVVRNAKVRTTDSVMGLPKALIEKLLKEAF